MVGAAAPVAGAIAGALTGGVFAGGLHAIAGEYYYCWSFGFVLFFLFFSAEARASLRTRHRRPPRCTARRGRVVVVVAARHFFFLSRSFVSIGIP